MNFLLVGLTLLVLAATMVGCAVLGTDRLVPGRRITDHLSESGIDVVSDGEPPLILSDRPDAQELKQLRFATSALGYNRDEVDGVLAKMVAENTRLRQELAATRGEEGSGSDLS